jgi:Arc/MetJ-type ribon-helix-helix transcriptional regulator
MRKTSVYLTVDEAESLRRLSVREGRSQAELIREGIRRVIEEVDAKPRIFRSLGAGRAPRAKARRSGPPKWDSDELYRKVMGER